MLTSSVQARRLSQASIRKELPFWFSLDLIKPAKPEPVVDAQCRR